MNDPLRSRWTRLRQHPAFHAAVIFASAGWLIIQGLSVFEVPTSVLRIIGVIFLIGFVGMAAYAWVASGREQTGSPSVTLIRGRRSRVVAIAVVVLVALGGAAWLLGPRLFSDGVEPGTNVIAVLPFSTSGPSVGFLGEGLVDLLSTNLNEVGGIRTVDPRTTLHHWRRVAPKGGTDLDGALRVARAVRANSVLLGSVIEVGGKVRLSARLLDLDGKELAVAADDAPSDSVLALVDRLSVKLLSSIWRPSQPLPELRLSAITTTSPAALRAYLLGEQFYRRSQWDSARNALEDAIKHDSTFALAHFRIGESFGWSEGLGSASAREHAASAERHATRLPARDKALLVAHRLHEEGKIEAIDSLRTFTARYPDDAVGWHFFADAQFHAGPVMGSTPKELLEPFDRVLVLDSTLTPALQHPLELTAAVGDSTAFNRYLRALERASPDPREVAFFQSLKEVRFGPAANRVSAYADGLRTKLRSVADGNRMMRALMNAEYAEAKPSLARLTAALDTARLVAPNAQAKAGVDAARAIVHVAFGRYERAQTVLDSLRPGSDQAMQVAILGKVAGISAREFGARELQQVEKAPPIPPVIYFRTLFAIIEGDLAGARNHLKAAPRDSASHGFSPETFKAVGGWITALEGDTARGLNEMIAATRAAGYGPGSTGRHGALLFARTLLQLENPQTRQRALEHLRYLLANDPALEFFSARRLGASLEAAELRDEAALVYARTLNLLEGGDPSTRQTADALRQALLRLRPQ
jgi:TolB-like protein/tetratricopeptide (TPR) repeat protein